MCIPPLGSSVCPVMYEASSERMNATTDAISLGSAMRAIGCCAVAIACIWIAAPRKVRAVAGRIATR